MKKMKILIAVTLLAASSYTFADLKVGVVSVQQVFQQAPQGQATVNKLKQTLGPQVAKLNSEQSALDTAVTNFNRNAPTLSTKDKASQQAAITTQQAQFQQDVAAFRKTEGQVQQSAAQTFQTDLVNAINQVAQQGSYDMVLTDQTVPFYKDSFDVTSQVITLMQGMKS